MQQPQAGRARARDFGIILGTLPPGPLNAITDVAGVRVEHATLPNGAPEGTRRTVEENCRTLRFEGFGFEAE